MSYPDNLRQNIQYLTNYSRNVVKILPNNTRDEVTVTSGTDIKFTLPPNSLLNLDDFTVNAVFECDTVETGTTWAIPRYLTRNANALIQRMHIECQGQTIFDVDDYNIINQIFSDYQKGVESTYKNLLNNPDCLQNYDSTGEPIGILSVPSNAGDVVLNRRPIVLSQFLGFLSGHPSYIDTSITGNITITIYLAPASHVLINGINKRYNATLTDAITTPGAPSTPSYKLKNMYASITKASIDDGIYFESVSNAIRSGMPFTMRHQNYKTIKGNACNKTTNLRYEVSGKSVDMAIFTFQHVNAGNVAPLQRRNGVNENFTNVKDYLGMPQTGTAVIDSASIDGTNPTAALTINATVTSQLYRGGTKQISNLGHPGVFASQYFIRDGAGVTSMQWQINGENLPQYRYSMADAFQQSMIDFGQSNDTLGGIHPAINSFKNWQDNFFICTARLNHLSGDDSFVSGFDTSGTPLILQIQTESTGVANPDFYPWMCVVNTQVLQWYAGRNLVIQR